MNLFNKMKSSKRKLTRLDHVILVYTLSSLDLLAMMVPVIVIIWNEVGMTFGEMLLVQGIFTAVVLVTEVPSGALSDSWLGRKWTEVTSAFLLSIGLALYAIAQNIVAVILAEVFAGLAIAMGTGNSSALLYDSLKESNKQNSFTRIVAKVTTLSFISASVTNILGGYLGVLYLRLPFIVLAIIYLAISLYTAIAIKEPERTKAKTMKAATMQATRSIITKPILTILITYTISTMVFSRIVFWSYQQLLINIGSFGPIELGFTMASFNIVAALGSTITEKVKQLLRQSIWILAILTVLATVSTAFVVIATDILSLLASVYLIQLVRGISRTYYIVIQQQYLASSERATFNSIDSLKNSLLYTIISALQAKNSVQESLQQALIGYILISLLVVVSSLLFSIKQVKKQNILIISDPMTVISK
jgi:predicted MFS family arabinose efflux permease